MTPDRESCCGVMSVARFPLTIESEIPWQVRGFFLSCVSPTCRCHAGMGQIEAGTACRGGRIAKL